MRNSSGEVVENKTVSLKIAILSGSINGSSVYSETHAKTTDASGLISIEIGNGTVISGIFANIDWGGSVHFIKLEADFNGGSNYIVLGTQELMSVPYAMYATKTDTSVLNLTNRLATKLNATDTVSLSNRINANVNSNASSSDTSLLNLTSRLATKLNVTDTASLSNRIELKLTKTDTAYLSNRIDLKLTRTDAIITNLQNQVAVLSTFLLGLNDIDGNNYPVVKIGNQIWMKENLRVSRYRNGDLILIVTDDTAWGALTTGGRSWYSNDSTTYEIPYGNLYNWYAVADSRGLCPTGWHVPSDAEWTTLTTYLEGESVARDKMKSIGTSFWNRPNAGATNESGFSALPGGCRCDGSFNFIRDFAVFWSATENGARFAWRRFLYNGSGEVIRDINNKTVGASVRCLRD